MKAILPRENNALKIIRWKLFTKKIVTTIILLLIPLKMFLIVKMFWFLHTQNFFNFITILFSENLRFLEKL